MSEPLFTSKKMNWEEVKDNLKKLDNISIQGFYRYSNAEKEVYLDNSPLPLNDINRNNNSFLYEAAFYVENSYSVSIRQYNDFWLWNEVQWNEMQPDISNDESTCYSQIASSNRRLKFHTHYKMEKNNDFDVLQPAWTAFVGFEDK